MSNKPPPTPPAGRSPKGTGDDKQAPPDGRAEHEGKKPDRGQQANIKQNTRNQGYQQDR